MADEQNQPINDVVMPESAAPMDDTAGAGPADAASAAPAAPATPARTSRPRKKAARKAASRKAKWGSRKAARCGR